MMPALTEAKGMEMDPKDIMPRFSKIRGSVRDLPGCQPRTRCSSLLSMATILSQGLPRQVRG